ncbi:glycoside hydrolase family 3 C-terminal domain-containing protein [Microbacterium sp. zg.Y1090]|uniref:beta-glucosidase family protein n=1 Tax=Microbacterium TaxID=33882 RepID=UPI00214C537C|nr:MULTISPECIES: glycoside hydrolase family 3 N-terminal domain-containing protein [unclassified Microbacterium]MCR2813240.1 glycoside hydrolase family 3 C-terminal domain-containing protein [Microbacterium sp. zg.Y1084]MCR2819553.1 glycoside hydrolase family 3 C-terminal domain-containing protein [Microbacterium sp. zg.Y1090]WIM28520.1 glycoside hydrolase family 3 N-terminal domain-containing protein [Microbacterium sp. zg-Y1090]
MTDTAPSSAGTASWQDTTRTATERAEALLAQLTVEEKVAQLTGYWFDKRGAGEVVAPMQDTLGAGRPPFEVAARDGLGHLTRVIGTTPAPTEEVVTRLADVQRVLMRDTRLGIPAIAHEECLTGVNALGATVYPAPIAWGASFDAALTQRIGAAIGADLRALGVHQGLSPVLDVVRDYRWGRVEETIGEDPVLVGGVGGAYVRGLEDAGIIATLKHFVGYSASLSGRNHAPVAVGPRELADVLLVPFELAVRDSGVRSVMNSYSDLDGLPVAADRHLLTDLLRGEWGFTGTVVSDYWAVAFLATAHRVARDAAHAGRLALEAGLDVELPNGMCFPPLGEMVRAGDLDVAVVDTAVRRVLRQKAELGLLDAQPAIAGTAVDLDPPANRALAREAAEASVVLLRNEGDLLPLSAQTRRRIAVIGPTADTARALLGCYSYPVHVLPRHPELGLGIDVPTVLDALRAEFPHADIVHERGADFLDADESGIPAAVAAARDADLVILTVGDLPGMFGRGTSGEGCDATDLTLPGGQSALVDAVLAVGTPVVLVTNSGRPYAFDHPASIVPAAVQAFIPGEEGAAAVAGVLSGRVNPGGRLPVQIPRIAGGGQHVYLGAPLTRTIDRISNLPTEPAFPFGHGLSYGSVDIAPGILDAEAIATDGTAALSTVVRNTGTSTTPVVVQLYVSDPVAEVARPVRRLVGFAKATLQPGAAAAIAFTVSPELAAYTGIDLRRRVDAGTLVFSLGRSSEDLVSEHAVEVVGDARHVGAERMIVAPVTVAAD